MVGSGREVLVLVHGTGCDQSVWDTYLPWLTRHCRVITYDLPFAGSADPDFFDLRRHDVIEGHAQVPSSCAALGTSARHARADPGTHGFLI